MEFYLYSHYYICYIVATCEEIFAGVAQLVEQRFCKPRVVRSIRIASFGQIPKWSTGTDCKSVAHALRGFESFSAHSTSPKCFRLRLRRNKPDNRAK